MLRQGKRGSNDNTRVGRTANDRAGFGRMQAIGSKVLLDLHSGAAKSDPTNHDRCRRFPSSKCGTQVRFRARTVRQRPGTVDQWSDSALDFFGVGDLNSQRQKRHWQKQRGPPGGLASAGATATCPLCCVSGSTQGVVERRDLSSTAATTGSWSQCGMAPSPEKCRHRGHRG